MAVSSCAGGGGGGGGCGVGAGVSVDCLSLAERVLWSLPNELIRGMRERETGRSWPFGQLGSGDPSGVEWVLF